MATTFRAISAMTTCLVSVAMLAGCSLWPFADTERTTYITPAKRVAEIEQIAHQATGEDNTQQQQLTMQLAEKIRTEPDPLVREAILRAASQFPTDLANRILLAAADDSDHHVRQSACKWLGRRRNQAALETLGRLAGQDDNVDVRLAATRALGELGHPSAVSHLSNGLYDRDPALQLASVESLKLSTGMDLGNDVAAWREWVATQGGVGGSQTAVAGRP